MASSDDHTAAVVLWNTGDRSGGCHDPPRSPAVSRRGRWRFARIDEDHASFIDRPAPENLIVEARQAVTSHAATWAGTVPAQGVVLLRVTDTARESLLRPGPHRDLCPPRIGGFLTGGAGSYADYDPRTCIARLGMGRKAFGVAQTGIVLDQPCHLPAVAVTASGRFARQGRQYPVRRPRGLRDGAGLDAQRLVARRATTPPGAWPCCRGAKAARAWIKPIPLLRWREDRERSSWTSPAMRRPAGAGASC